MTYLKLFTVHKKKLEWRTFSQIKHLG